MSGKYVQQSIYSGRGMHGFDVGPGVLVDEKLLIRGGIWNFSGNEELASCEHMEIAKHPMQT